MVMEITDYLLAAVSVDAVNRTEAVTRLQQYQEQNLSAFILSMAAELSNNEKPIESRRQAGMVLKNSLDDKDSLIKEQLVQQWMTIDINVKSQVKDMLLTTLESQSPEARHTSAQVIAKVAGIEIPQKLWPELIETLLANLTKQENSAGVKQATLETLGYIYEEISHQDLVPDEMNSVLTAIVQGMNLADHSPEVRLAATKALYNALEFELPNFNNEVERNYIIEMVSQTALAKETKIRQAAFECLVSIVPAYYEFLKPYMPALTELTYNAARSDEIAVVLLAIGFWSSICDEEMKQAPHSSLIENAISTLVPLLLHTLLRMECHPDIWTCIDLVHKTVGCHAVWPYVRQFILENLSKTDSRARKSATFVFDSVRKITSIEDLLSIVPSLLEILLKQEEEDSKWYIPEAAGVCLELLAKKVGSAVLPYVIHFAQVNISKADWRARDGATLAIWSILEGLSKEDVLSLVPTLIETFLKYEEDKDHVSWEIPMAAATCLGLVAEAVGEASVLPHLISFVNNNMFNGDWRIRQAASFASGLALERTVETNRRTVPNKCYRKLGQEPPMQKTSKDGSNLYKVFHE